MSTDTLDILGTVELLVGASNFKSWKQAISTLLQAKGLWGHVEGNESPLDPRHRLAIRHEQTPAATPYSTAEQNWVLADAKAILIITLRIAPAAQSRLPQGTDKTARVIWKAIHDLFGQQRHQGINARHAHGAFDRPTIISAFELRKSLYYLTMKDHRDYKNYLSKFTKARARLAALNHPVPEIEMVCCIIQGLPKHGSWEVFNMVVFHMVNAHIEEQAASKIPSAPLLLSPPRHCACNRRRPMREETPNARTILATFKCWVC